MTSTAYKKAATASNEASTANNVTSIAYDGSWTASNEASAPYNQASDACAEPLTAYEGSMSWAELSEEAFRMTHDPRSEAEIRDVTAGGWVWRAVHPGWKPNQGWEPS